MWTARQRLGVIRRRCRAVALDSVRAPVATLRARFSARRLRRVLPAASVDLVSVAFRNTVVLREQHRLLHQHIVDPFCWIVADNSPDTASAQGIRRLCAELGAVYWRIPSNPYTEVGPSPSHGFALNLAWRCLLRDRRSEVTGFLDHDIFPVRAFSPVASVAVQPVWGRFQQYDDIWYLWPGLMFVRTEHARRTGLDFMPVPGADTGAANFALLFERLDRDDVVFPSDTQVQVRGDGSDYQSDFVDHIDGWVHTINGSYWKAVPEKESRLRALLDGC